MAAANPIEPVSQPPSPWHRGETTLQKIVGVADRMETFGRKAIRDHMPDQHRQFYAQLPFIVAGGVDPQGDAWATLLTGNPGFIQSPDPRRLSIATHRDENDPATAGMSDGDAIGLLGIELHTRRRNRLNGTVRSGNGNAFDVLVEHSFGNCPQYIQLRDFQFIDGAADRVTPRPELSDHLDARARSLIAGADTFFVASYVDLEDGRRQVDVSHRGGKPGFVRIGDDGVLTVPEFAGNLFFNTLGNFLLNPRAGLVFVDFRSGDVLQLTGTAEVILESPEIAAFQGAERLWRFTPRLSVFRAGALPLRWQIQEEGWSPNSLMTGSWEQAAERLNASDLRETWRPFRIARLVRESDTIVSFHLEPADGAGLLPHLAGQHLPIRVHLPGEEKPNLRTYTLSVAPSDGAYRISVKREGAVSKYLHDVLKEGDIIEARAPAGAFTINAGERRPAVLMAAGVGVTPLLAMLRHLVYEGLRTRRVRRTWFIYSAHSKAERAFDGELAELVARADGAVTLVRLLGVPDGAVEGVDYEATGRVDMALLRRILPFDDYDFYLCGPSGFMQSIHDGLRDLNVADARIHAEAFGPASLLRRLDAAPVTPRPKPSSEPVPVAFTKSGKEARWMPESGSLLELAEARGLNPEFSCRSGSCGTCRTRILEGKVAYAIAPAFETAENEALICRAVPAAADDADDGGNRLILDL
jgi:ferredoxin-NADP reductase/predicted pyridoxine 5'-phosphate oxidase superfamily flavin-nucleotide-binding protein